MKVLRIGVTRGDVKLIDIPNTLEALQREQVVHGTRASNLLLSTAIIDFLNDGGK